MDELNLLIDLHVGADRQGPGDAAQTRKAIALAGLSPASQLKVADIGCGTGASTMVLAQDLRSQIVAVDTLPEFLGALRSRAERAGLSDRITTMSASMDSLPFEDGSLDVMWSEGAIYNIGFANGVRQWRRFLKPGGLLAVSELTWLTARRPIELEEHWRAQYAEVATASSKMDVLERAGYEPVGYFVLPEHCWIDAYYRPMQRRFPAFLERHGSSEAAKAVVAAEVLEIDLYECFRRFVSYGFYIARKIDDGP
ncbi:class I SAM-dependent methyltransferase [Silanimonas sp.]|jgi:SAM-dependent methyltransferase|uniref:class I SAM-dependent methyltransferase n=1 Tax=Silanimonas sp. TaxID=1929290 RepID=UPI0037CB6EDC